jgi:DnaJ like chaperone protein
MIWGKIIGGMAGLALGHSPLAMLAGVAVGHWADLRLARYFPDADMVRRRDVFATGVSGLAAKLSKVDGPVTRDEVDAFKEQFRFSDDQMAHVAATYDDAKTSPIGFEPFARSLADHFASEPFLLAEIFAALYRIAAVDGGVNHAEQMFLQRVAEIFGLAYHSYAEPPPSMRMRPARDISPYQILGVDPQANSADIKAAWRRLTREHHPDTLMAKGVPADYVEKATQKMAEINAAYDKIRQERGET